LAALPAANDFGSGAVHFLAVELDFQRTASASVQQEKQVNSILTVAEG